MNGKCDISGCKAQSIIDYRNVRAEMCDKHHKQFQDRKELQKKNGRVIKIQVIMSEGPPGGSKSICLVDWLK